MSFGIFAVRTGLEPATPGVTGRYSNQLNYRTIVQTLCVFLERGCKGTHFFYISKFFQNFFLQKCAWDCELWHEKTAAGITLAAVGCSESENSIFRKSGKPLFYFDHAFLFFDLWFLKLWNVDFQDTVLNCCPDSFLIRVFRKDECLVHLHV